MSLKNLVSNTIATCILILLFLIAFTWIIFDFNQSSSSLKDSFSIVSSLFGGIATLAAAYIASRLFNDWKEQQRHINSSEFARIVMSSYKEFDRYFTGLNDLLIDELELVKIWEADKDEEIIESSKIDVLLDMSKKFLDLFYVFQDDLLNYCYVSKSQSDVNSVLESWENDVHSFHDKLVSLSSDIPAKLLITKLEELLSDRNYSLVADFSKEINEIVLKPLRLEN